MLLELCSQHMPKGQDTITTRWLVHNSKENTPLHEVLMTNNNKLVVKLLNLDKGSASVVNNCKEAPLHLMARCSIPSKCFNYATNTFFHVFNLFFFREQIGLRISNFQISDPCILYIYL